VDGRETAQETIIMHTLPELPYALDALEPHISRETLDYHYSKHHRGYVNNLNELLKGTDLERMSLEAVIRASSPAPGHSDPIFNNAAQAWNHQFYWQCLTPQTTVADGIVSQALVRHFGSVDGFRREFTRTALDTFGSGWAWLVSSGDGRLEILGTRNADTPQMQDRIPLLTCDMWEHAYYIDYRNSRAEYLQGFWKLVNWDFVAAGLERIERPLDVA
jgi:Fe-Mn family superoxide dismutase